ncbi:MAG: hypothetical protein H5T96_09850, partial [Tissierellales bacterium]|nr:hypothetical protein [Tissierellales bacterium]
IMKGGNLKSSFHSTEFRKDYTEITFEQFKKFVMKEEKSPEDKLLEEAKRRYPIGSKFHPVHTPKDECIITNTTFSYNKNGSPGTSRENITALTDEGKHFSSRAKYGNTSSDRVVWTKDDGWAEIISSPKEIEEWGVGSYVVFLKDIRAYKKGEIDIIVKAPPFKGSNMSLEKDNLVSSYRVDKELKWFATKEEAEEYSKSITEKKEVGELEGFKVGEEVEIVRNGAYISGISSGTEPIKGSTRTIQHFNRPIKGIYDWYVTFTDGSVFGGNKGELYKYIKHISSPKEEVKEKEMKFEVGKWYKNPDWGYKDSYYGKLTDVVPKDLSIFPSKEYIRNGEYRNSGNYFTSAKNCVEVPLEEIQQYLPEGHVDKLPKDVEYKAGDWVVVLPNDRYYDNCEKKKAQKIVKILKGDSLPYRLEFSDGHTNTYHSIRHATPEEIQKAKGEEPMKEFIKDKWYVFIDNPLKIACYQGGGKGYGFWGNVNN